MTSVCTLAPEEWVETIVKNSDISIVNWIGTHRRYNQLGAPPLVYAVLRDYNHEFPRRFHAKMVNISITHNTSGKRIYLLSHDRTLDSYLWWREYNGTL